MNHDNKNNNINENKYASLYERLEKKRDDFFQIDDSSHKLINFYFSNLFREIDEQSFLAYNLLSKHFNNLIVKTKEIENKVLESLDDECLETEMKQVANKIDDFLQSDQYSIEYCLNLIREEQEITSMLAHKLNKYFDFKKFALTPIKSDLNFGDIFGNIVEQDNFHMRVPNQKFNFLSISTSGEFKVWKTNKSNSEKSFVSNQEITFSRLINGDKTLLTIGEKINLYEMNTFKLIVSLPSFDDYITSYKLTSDEKIIACYNNGVFRLWDLVKYKLINTVVAHNDAIYSVKIISNKHVLTGGKDGLIKLWKFRNGDLEKVFYGHTKKVFKIKLLSNQHFISSSGDKTIKIWNINEGKCIRTLIGHLDRIPCMKLIQPNKLITGSLDSTIKFWYTDSGGEITTLRGHTKGISYLKVIIDANKLISTSGDYTIKVWALLEGTCLQSFIGHEMLVLDVKILPTGLFLSASYDGSVKIWSLNSSKSLATYKEQENPVLNVHVLF